MDLDRSRPTWSSAGEAAGAEVAPGQSTWTQMSMRMPNEHAVPPFVPVGSLGDVDDTTTDTPEHRPDMSPEALHERLSPQQYQVTQQAAPAGLHRGVLGHQGRRHVPLRGVP